MRRRGIRTKLIGGFLIVASSVALAGIVGNLSVTRVRHDTDIVLGEQLPVLRAVQRLEDALHQAQISVLKFINTSEREKLEVYARSFRQNVADYHRFINAILNGSQELGIIACRRGGETERLTRKAQKRFEDFQNLCEQMMQAHRNILREESKGGESRSPDDRFEQTVDGVREALRTIRERVKEKMTKAALDANHTQNLARVAFILITLLGVGIAVNLGVFISRSITRPLLQVVHFAKRVGGGDLSGHINVQSRDEIGDLAEALNQTVANLKDQMEYAESINKGIPDPLFIVNPELTITYMNRACEQMTGYSAEETVNKMKCFDVFKSDICNSSCLLKQCMRTGGSIAGREVKIRDRRGEEIPVTIGAGLIKDSRGEIVGGFEICQDLRPVLENQRRYLHAQIKPIKEVINAVAEADLTREVRIKEGSDLYELGLTINKMVSDLQDMVKLVNQASSQVASAASQISSSSEQMASGAEEQSQQTTQIATSVQEMTTTILQISQNAAEAVRRSKEAGEVANKGNAVVKDAVAEINSVSRSVEELVQMINKMTRSSQDIDQITKVIEDIADQTNLLALNAAIEAARAGEQGRGFTVVADEVRKLAERTTEATKMIAEKVRIIQKDAQQTSSSMQKAIQRVMRGTELSNRAGEALEEIVKQAGSVVEMIEQIATATHQQSAAAEQISKNIEAISTVAKQSATGAEQMARAAEELHQLTENLQRLVGRFRLKKEIRRYGRRADDKSTVYIGENGALIDIEGGRDAL